MLSHVPSYFALDDHEIDNNWPQDENRPRFGDPRASNGASDPLFSFPAAKKTAWNFLIHHSSDVDQLWYDFESAGYPFFVFDTRTERMDNCKVIGEKQQAGFSTWLKRTRSKGSGKPVILVSGSPLGPISGAYCEYPELSAHSDTLIRFPGFWQCIVNELAENQVKEVLWISGDNHQSSICEYTLKAPGSNSVKIHHLVASGLFAPLPFARRNWSNYPAVVNFIGGKIEITGNQLLLCDSSSHFVHVLLKTKGDRTHLSVHTVDADGTQTAIVERTIGH